MRWTVLLAGCLGVVVVGALAVGCSASTEHPPPSNGDGAVPIDTSDDDSDTISNSHEVADDGRDTDRDGTPDYRDTDSDADSIPDSFEAGDSDLATPPVDSDGDGVADAYDTDSDDNGLLDSEDGTNDTDGDGIADYADRDDDNDLAQDLMELSRGGPGADSDGDGVPNYRDSDSDNDTIMDGHEFTADTDADGLFDYEDTDTDGDGVPDIEEAGDLALMTAPVDTDDDGTADFRDTDSDNDGLSDADELLYGTSRTIGDTDGDGVVDLVEVAACPPRDTSCAGDATNPDSSPRTRGDFVFLVPYMEPPDPVRDTLDFATNLRVADVYFLMDTTGSMGGAITSLRSGLSTPGTGLIDRVRSVIPETWFGVGGFDDYPVSPYGSAGSDLAYYHFQDMTGDTTIAQAAVNRYATHSGNDGPESDVPALWAVATGRGLPGMSAWTGDRASGYMGFTACPSDRSEGWPCFRDGAVPIVILMTDIEFHNGPGGTDPYTVAGADVAPTYLDAVAALNAANVRVIGIAVSGGGRSDLEAIARDTGSVDAAGAPLVSNWSSGSPIGDAVVDQISTLATQAEFDITLVYQDDTSDGVDTRTAFLDHYEANTTGSVERGCEPRDAVDSDGDGWDDMFENVSGGARVCFDIVVKQNDTVMPTPHAQLFQATLRILGDGFTELDARTIYFLVPPHIEMPGGPG